MKAAFCAVGALLSLFISLFSALKLLALHASEIFEGRPPEDFKILWLKLSACIFFALAVAFVLMTYRSLGPARPPN